MQFKSPLTRLEKNIKLFLINRVVKRWSKSPYIEGQRISPERRYKMRHKMNINVSKEEESKSVMTSKKVKVKKSLFKKLFGSSQKVTIIIPGDSVSDVTISEIKEKSDGGSHGR